MTNEQIEQLVFAARNGDEQAKNNLYEVYKPIVRAICHRLFLLGGEKEDLLQEGMIGLFDAVASYDSGISRFSTFATLCIRRRIYNAIDKANTDNNRLLQSALPLDIVDNYPDNSLSRVEDGELLKLIKAFIVKNLTDSERTVAEYFLEGYTHEEIASLTHKSYKSVDGALQRARKKLSAFKEQL